jgi:hypothetical protein
MEAAVKFGFGPSPFCSAKNLTQDVRERERESEIERERLEGRHGMDAAWMVGSWHLEPSRRRPMRAARC